VSSDRSDLPAVVKHGAAVAEPTLSSSLAVPSMVANAGGRAARRFFAGAIGATSGQNPRAPACSAAQSHAYGFADDCWNESGFRVRSAELWSKHSPESLDKPVDVCFVVIDMWAQAHTA
jgi:hypothetical protein